jgi:hypothetical protein
VPVAVSSRDEARAGYALDRDRGFVIWSLSFETGEQRNVDLGYAIHLPESWQVGGF